MLECISCLKVLQDPQDVSYCHRSFCKRCIEKVLTASGVCPSCSSKLSSFKPNQRKAQYLSLVHVPCVYHHLGCDWVGELAQLDDHINENSKRLQHCNTERCQYLEVRCEYCHFFFQRQFIYDHQEKCPNRYVHCPNKCGMIVDCHKMKEHVTDRCPLTIINCIHEGCTVLFPRKDISNHLESCNFVELQCFHCHHNIKHLNLHEHNHQCPKWPLQCKYCGEFYERRLEEKHLHNQCPGPATKASQPHFQIASRLNGPTTHRLLWTDICCNLFIVIIALAAIALLLYLSYNASHNSNQNFGNNKLYEAMDKHTFQLRNHFQEFVNLFQRSTPVSLQVDKELLPSSADDQLLNFVTKLSKQEMGSSTILDIFKELDDILLKRLEDKSAEEMDRYNFMVKDKDKVKIKTLQELRKAMRKVTHRDHEIPGTNGEVYDELQDLVLSVQKEKEKSPTYRTLYLENQIHKCIGIEEASKVFHSWNMQIMHKAKMLFHTLELYHIYEEEEEIVIEVPAYF